MSPSHWSSCSTLRQFTVGNEPITPLRQAATTRSEPETRNIGAAISGRLRRSRKRDRGSMDGTPFLSWLEPHSYCASVTANIGTTKPKTKQAGEKNEQSALCVSGGMRADVAGAGALSRAHGVQLAGRIDHVSRRDRHDR